MYEYRNLENISFEEISNAINLAFNDYIVPIKVTPESIEARFKVSGVDYSMSFGAFYENKLVGLLVNSIDMYKGNISAFDALTGIVKEHRNNGVFSRLYEYTMEFLKNNNIMNYYLEVIKTNEKALNIYKKKGLKIEREFSYIAGNMKREFSQRENIKILKLSDFPFNEELCNYEPAFENRINALKRNESQYEVMNTDNVFIIFNKNGHVPQIKYNKLDSIKSLYSLLSYLSKHFEKLSFSDIPVTEDHLISELLNCGFNILVNQYEMGMELKSI